MARTKKGEIVGEARSKGTGLGYKIIRYIDPEGNITYEANDGFSHQGPFTTREVAAAAVQGRRDADERFHGDDVAYTVRQLFQMRETPPIPNSREIAHELRKRRGL